MTTAPETVAMMDLSRSSNDCWDGRDRADLVCRRVVPITHDVTSFVFGTDPDRVFRFRSGQFVTLELTIAGQRVDRCYTISSPPTRPHTLTITVKRVPGGLVSGWLHDHVTVGTRVTATAPRGAFTLDAHPAPKYLFLSAGSGITPLMSITRTLYDLGADTDVRFVHSARTPADLIFRAELDAMASTMPNLRVVQLCEDDHPTQRWLGLRGRLTAGLLRAVTDDDLADRVTFTCGPAPYMAAVRAILDATGYDRAGYHEESFSFAPVPVAVPSVPGPVPVPDSGAGNGTGHTVEFVRSGRTIVCDRGQNVLDAALAAGLRPPSSCGRGMCGTCRTTLLDGEVDMRHNGGIRPREIRQNSILICCSTPLSDLRIDA